MGRASCDFILFFLRRFSLHFRRVPGETVTRPQARLAPRAAVRAGEWRGPEVMAQAVLEARVVEWQEAVDQREPVAVAGVWPRKR